MVCSSCGHDNPRENRYCGMCGAPFPHRFLPVPDEQSALTFPIAPIEIAPSQLPIPAEPPSPAATLITGPVEEALAATEPIEPSPVPVASLPTVVEEPGPVTAASQAADAPSLLESPVVEPEPVAEISELAAVPGATLVETSQNLRPFLVDRTEVERAEPHLETPPEATASPDVAVEPSPSVAALSEAPMPVTGAVEHAPPLVSHDEVPPHTSQLPEIRRYATPHVDAMPTRVDTDPRTPSVIQRPHAPQTLEPPPDSAGMPTFQSVAEASGAPPISPFEPPVAKDANEDRELQEFVASFRYHPPVEAFDELTMRSEVPVLDAEAPVTPSHPSFDDDVPPPPEAGPHPTGEEYYPSAGTAADRSHYLEIADTHHAAPSHHASTASTTSFLGLDDSPPADVSLADEVASRARRHWLLWTSLVALVVIFGTLGFFEGRAQIDHAMQGPIEIVREQFAKLRQRASETTSSAPATTTDRTAPEAPASAEPKSNPPSTDQPVSKAQPETSASTNPPASSAVQPATTAEPQPRSSAPIPQTTTEADAKTTIAPPTSPAKVAPEKPATVTPSKPAPDATSAKREPATEPPLAVSKPRSKSDPGQQELANAMQASDPAAAAAWLWKATSRGNPVAPIRLADLYIKGKGVPHSCEQALVLLRSEAAKDNAPARNRLAALYANGTCVARDRVKAYQLMSFALAVDPGSEWAEQNRKELWQQMTPEERTQAQKYR